MFEIREKMAKNEKWSSVVCIILGWCEGCVNFEQLLRLIQIRILQPSQLSTKMIALGFDDLLPVIFSIFNMKFIL